VVYFSVEEGFFAYRIKKGMSCFSLFLSYAYLLTFVLPLLLTGLFADKFISLLNYAGIILVFLAILGPLAMVIQVRKLPDLSADNGQVYTAEGGQIALFFTFVFAVFILASQFV
jgi:tyrosine-specific transport protein